MSGDGDTRDALESDARDALESDARDAERVGRHLAGDEAAFGELFSRHYRRLVRRCECRGADPGTAEDVAQEAFLRALSTLGGLKRPERFYPWLAKIADRLMIDHDRRQGRVVLASDPDAGVVPAAEDLWLARKEAADVALAFGRVRSRHQEVIRLVAFEGLSYEAAAARLGGPVTTVPGLLHRARAACRREYLAVNRLRHSALAPLCGVLLGAARRLRERLVQASAGLPDLSGLTAPAAGVVLGLGVLFAPAAERADAAAPRAGSSSPVIAREAPAGSAPRDEPIPPPAQTVPASRQDGSRPPGPAAEPPPGRVVAGVAEVSVDEDRAEWTRERSRERSAYLEVGPWWLGADPDWLHKSEVSLPGPTREARRR